MSAHIPTLFLVIIMVGSLLSMSVAVITDRSKQDGVMFWAAGLGMNTAAVVFISLFQRGHVDEFSATVLATALLVPALVPALARVRVAVVAVREDRLEAVVVVLRAAALGELGQVALEALPAVVLLALVARVAILAAVTLAALVSVVSVSVVSVARAATVLAAVTGGDAVWGG